MKNIISRANQKISVGWAASLLSGSFLLSAVLGLARERLLIANFGIGEQLDAYNIAFSVPDFMYYLLVSGALSVTFIPILNQRLSTGNKHSAWRLSSSLINLLAIVTFISSILIFIFAEPLVSLIANGASAEVKTTATSLMRIIAINPFLFSISTVLASMQQAVGRFFFNAIAPVIYNIGIIIGIVFFAPAIGTPENPAILGVALGVSLGAVAQLLFQLLGMIGIDFEYKRKIFWKNQGFRKVLRLLPARSFDQSIDYLNSIIEKFIASFLFAGAITSYQAAFTLRNVPITLIGVAISIAAFPSITERAASTRTDLFRKDIVKTLEWIFWLAAPAAVIAFFMRGYLVRLLVASGNLVISQILAWFTISILFRALFHTVTRAFYARQDTKTPLVVSIAAVLLNIVLAFQLVGAFGIVGLAMAQSAVAVFEVVVLLIILQREVGQLFYKDNVVRVSKMIFASIATGGINYVMLRYIFPLRADDVGFFTLAPKFGFMVLVSIASYFVISYFLRLSYAEPVIKKIANIFYREVTVE